MPKKHTAQSLGKYFGNKIFVKVGYINYENKPNEDKRIYDQVIILNHLCSNHIAWVPKEQLKGGSWLGILYTAAPKDCLPYLKDYTQLDKPMMHEGKEIVPLEFVYGDEYNIITTENYGDIEDDFKRKGNNLSTCMLEKLIALGFGAVPDKESSTGWVGIADGKECALDEG